MVPCIYSFFNPHKERFSIPKKSYLPSTPFSLERTLFLSERSTVRPTLPIAFTLFPRSETLNSGQRPRPGDAQKRTSIKTHKGDKVNRFLGQNLASLALFAL
jgi:hypothetical protein